MKREDIAKLLEEAASRLDPVNVLADAAPQINIKHAYDQSHAAWNATSGLIKPDARKSLRIAALACKAVMDQVTSNRKLYARDNDTLRNVSARLREVAAQVAPKQKAEANMQYSALGLRMRRLSDLVDAQPFVHAPAVQVKASVVDEKLDEDMKYIAQFNSLRGKLPKSVSPDKIYVACKLPILIITKKPLNEAALNRTGLTWKQMTTYGASKEPIVMHAKMPLESGHVVVLENQIVIGMRPNEVESRKGGGLVVQTSNPNKPNSESIRRHGTTKIASGAADIATKAINLKYGKHVNGLNHLESKYIRTPGNPLVWMWLVSSHAVKELDSMQVRSAGFPWLSKLDAAARADELETFRKELKELENQETILQKHGKTLDDQHHDRISWLRGELHEAESEPKPVVVTPEDREKNLNNMKAQLEQRLRKEYKSLFDAQDEVMEALKADPTDKKLLRERKQIEKQITEARETIAAKMRAAPRIK